MPSTITFSSAMAHAHKRGYPLSVLLGNGFSRAFGEEFAYSRLRDVAEMSQLNVGKDQLFDHAASDDFETVIRHLEQSAHLVALYDPSNERLKLQMTADAQAVKNGLVEALTTIHPLSGHDVSDDQYASARCFLSHFRRIFTLNYDLLLYWAVLQDRLVPPKVVTKDGFGRIDGTLTWIQPDRADEQEIFYLHGAMHFYLDRDGRLNKLEYADGRIVEQLQTNLRFGKFPLVVTEGSYQDKQARIAASRYLSYCHSRLSRIRGALFIHGMALSENDTHVLNAIAHGSGAIDALYVGLHGAPSETTEIVAAKARSLARVHAEKTGRTVEVKFYRSETAEPWA